MNPKVFKGILLVNIEQICMMILSLVCCLVKTRGAHTVAEGAASELSNLSHECFVSKYFAESEAKVVDNFNTAAIKSFI